MYFVVLNQCINVFLKFQCRTVCPPFTINDNFHSLIVSTVGLNELIFESLVQGIVHVYRNYVTCPPKPVSHFVFSLGD